MGHIGLKIKERREALGWSQEELSERMGYKSRTTIAKIETGVSDVYQANIKKFAKVLGVSVAYLMEWDGAEEPETTNEVQDDTYTALIRRYSKLTPAQKAVVDHLMESYITEDEEGANAG